MSDKSSKRAARAPRTLRKRAKAILGHTRQESVDTPEHDGQRLIYELQLHQIELEMQNEELRHTQDALETARNRYADLYEFAPIGYLSLDANGVILEANLTTTQQLGVLRAHLLRRQLAIFVAHDSEAQDAFHHHRLQVLREEKSCTCNLWMQRQDGTPFYAHLKSLFRREGHQGPLRWRLALIDLTALREQADAQMAWTAAIVESSHNAVIGTTQEGIIVSWNGGAKRLYGYEAVDIIGQSLDVLAAPACPKTPLHLLTTMQGGERIEMHESLHHTKDGRQIEVSLSLSPIRKRDGTLLGISMICQDITERKQHEAQLRTSERALRKSQAQLRRLVLRQQQLQEQERKRMAQELHDELAQSLTILHIDLAWLSERLETRPDVRERLQAMVTQVDELDQAMRRIAIELRPPMLDDLGLLATLEWQIEEVHQRTGLAYTLQLPAEYTPLDIDRTTALFRIFQEALTNVVRHANASRVDIRVVQDAKAVYLDIRDNGQGMTAAQQSQRHALGILGMHERAQVWGGEVAIQSHRVSGTSVTVRMPYGATTEPKASHDSSPHCR